MRNIIRAQFDEKTIKVYQAFRDEIANEAVKLDKFGPHFRVNRMSWIKPSFLWMMYRSGWATKKGQERILAIDIKRDNFDKILSNAVFTFFNKDIYDTNEKWKVILKNAEVRCQWDPDRDIYGNPIDKRTIQLGLSGKMLKKYKEEWTVKISDITDTVVQIREAILAKKFEKSMLPIEREYSLNNDNTNFGDKKI